MLMTLFFALCSRGRLIWKRNDKLRTKETRKIRRDGRGIRQAILLTSCGCYALVRPGSTGLQSRKGAFIGQPESHRDGNVLFFLLVHYSCQRAHDPLPFVYRCFMDPSAMLGDIRDVPLSFCYAFMTWADVLRSTHARCLSDKTAQ